MVVVFFFFKSKSGNRKSCRVSWAGRGKKETKSGLNSPLEPTDVTVAFPTSPLKPEPPAANAIGSSLTHTPSVEIYQRFKFHCKPLATSKGLAVKPKRVMMAGADSETRLPKESKKRWLAMEAGAGAALYSARSRGGVRWSV